MAAVAIVTTFLLGTATVPLMYRHHISEVDLNLSNQDDTIAKVSMLYGEPLRRQYIQALDSHQQHNHRFGYLMHVLRREIVSGYWNKPVYLLSLMLQELQKPAETRVQWFM